MLIADSVGYDQGLRAELRSAADLTKSWIVATRTDCGMSDTPCLSRLTLGFGESRLQTMKNTSKKNKVLEGHRATEAVLDLASGLRSGTTLSNFAQVDGVSSPFESLRSSRVVFPATGPSLNQQERCVSPRPQGHRQACGYRRPAIRNAGPPGGPTPQSECLGP
jgi:hypothetical protein